VPEGTAELVLLVEDPDAPGATFVHWILLGVDPGTSSIAEGETPPGASDAKTSFGDEGYGGPCPPGGDEPHRYLFTLYALRGPLDVNEDASPDEVRSAIGEAALARGQLTGRYGR
jgi:Raf kinase inhibitor-like YbhB/YbcL family protein